MNKNAWGDCLNGVCVFALVLGLAGCGPQERLSEVIDLGLVPAELTDDLPLSIRPVPGSMQIVLGDDYRRPQWLVDLNSPQAKPARMADRDGDWGDLDKRIRAFVDMRGWNNHVLSSASRDDTWTAVVDEFGEGRGRYVFAWKQANDSAPRVEDLGPDYETDSRRELVKSATQVGPDGSIAAVLVWEKWAVPGPGGGSPDWYGVELLTVHEGALSRTPLREWDSAEFVSELVLQASATEFWAASSGRRLFVWSFDAMGKYSLPKAIVGSSGTARLIPTSDGATVAWIDGRYQRMIAYYIDTAKYTVNTQVAVCRVNQSGIGPVSFLSPKDGNVGGLAAVSTPQGPCFVWAQRRVNPSKRDQLDPTYPTRLRAWIDRNSGTVGD